MRSSFGPAVTHILVGSVTLALVVAVGLGVSAGVRFIREGGLQERTVAGSRGAATPAPTAAPLAARFSRDYAIALITSITYENIRIDRIEAKLMTWAEYARTDTGIDRKAPAPKSPRAETVWVIAVAGDIFPAFWGPLGTPREHFPWAVWSVDAMGGDVTSLAVGRTGTWSPTFDSLPSYVAVAPPPTPAPPPRLAFTQLQNHVDDFLPPLRELVAADDKATVLYALADARAGALPTPTFASGDGGRTWRRLAVPAKGLTHIAARGNVVVLTDAAGGIQVSRDGAMTWSAASGADEASASTLRQPMGRVIATRLPDGRPVFLADQNGSGPSQILASLDGERWRRIGEVPGRAVFGEMRGAVVSFSGSGSGPGIYSVAGADLSSLQLAPVIGTRQAGGLQTDPASGELWSFTLDGGLAVRRSSDGGKTWLASVNGLPAGIRTVGIFFAQGRVYAIGDGAHVWDGSSWRTAEVLAGKAAAVFQHGRAVFLQDLPRGLWRLD